MINIFLHIIYISVYLSNKSLTKQEISLKYHLTKTKLVKQSKLNTKTTKSSLTSQEKYLASYEVRTNWKAQRLLFLFWMTAPLAVAILKKKGVLNPIFAMNTTMNILFGAYVVVFLLISFPVAVINHRHMARMLNGEKYLMTKGIYAYSRNPFYTNQLLLWVMFLWGSQYAGYYMLLITSAVCLPYCYYLRKTIVTEEEKLLKQYNKQYTAYKQSAPRFFANKPFAFLRLIVLWYFGRYHKAVN